MKCRLFVTLFILISFSLAAAAPLLNQPDSQQKREALVRREEKRERWQKLPAIFEALGLKEGHWVADVGSGEGFFTVRLARAVGATGRVFAVDIDERSVRELRQRVKEESLETVEVILGDTDNPKLPAGALDSVLIMNAYHEMKEHQAMLKNLWQALRLGGRLVLADYISKGRRNEPRSRQVKGHEIAPDVVNEELRQAGFEILDTRDPFILKSEGEGRTDMWLTVARRPLPVSEHSKTVVAELFTGSECPPCAAADRAFEKIIESYDRSSVVVLEYHQHIPAPDPMTSPDAEARARYYQVTGVPRALIDGLNLIKDGGPISQADERFTQYNEKITERLKIKSNFTIHLTGSASGSTVSIRAKVSGAGASENLKLRVALVEDRIEYTGRNGIATHPFTVRKFFGSPAGFPLDLKSGSTSIEANIDLAELTNILKAHFDLTEKQYERVIKDRRQDIDPDNLSAIAFIQNDKTREILQAQYAKIEAR